MKKYCVLLLFFLTIISCSQLKQSTNNSEMVSFIATVDINRATKEGIYMNGYVVEIDYDQIKKLDGKKVQVTGKVIVVKGLNEKDNIIKQGRLKDMKHIVSPKIKIVK